MSSFNFHFCLDHCVNYLCYNNVFQKTKYYFNPPSIKLFYLKCHIFFFFWKCFKNWYFDFSPWHVTKVSETSTELVRSMYFSPRRVLINILFPHFKYSIELHRSLRKSYRRVAFPFKSVLTFHKLAINPRRKRIVLKRNVQV